jgi:hypothetical protein
MMRPDSRPALKAVAIMALLGGCAPGFVDSQEALAPAARGGSTAIAGPPEQGGVIPSTSKPRDVVTPPPVPDPGAAIEPDVNPPLPPDADRVPPSPSLWPPPPPNYNAQRPDAVPLGIPNRPPASWRY